MVLIPRVAAAILVLAALAGAIGQPSSIAVLGMAAVADVGWPPSESLLVAEIVTGGASASDEWIEIANVAGTPADLGGLEVVYVTASGATVTRKASWPSGAALAAGSRFLLANAAGIHASIADATYSGGLAATGGTLVLRPIGGEPIDAVGWGDAVNTFVEGTPAAAPPAGSSIARRAAQGGAPIDTNDNAADLVVEPAPVPEGSGSGSSPSPVPTASPDPSTEPSPSPTTGPAPSSEPSHEPSPEPSPTLEPSAGPSPTLEPSAGPSPTVEPSTEPSPSPTTGPAPSPEPSPEPTPSASPTPVPSPNPSPDPTASPSPVLSPSPSPADPAMPIGDVRALEPGATAVIEGVLTTSLGALEAGRGGYIQDDSGGIALYLDAAAAVVLPSGQRVRVTGVVAERYAQLTLRAPETAIVDLGPGTWPSSLVVATGSAGEAFEGLVVGTGGWVVDGPDSLSDGEAVTIDDGTGPLRIVVAEALLVGAPPLGTGEWLDVVGPLGQRDSSGTGTTGYRVHVTRPGDLERSTAEPDPSPAPTTEPSPTGSPSPSLDPGVIPIAVARGLPVGATVRIQGVTTAEPGRVDKPPLVPLDDGTAGIIIRLPDGTTVGRGRLIEAVGRLADPYGQLEIRVADGPGIKDLGTALEPLPLEAGGADLGEAIEARLVTMTGRLLRTDRTTAGATTADLEDAEGVVFRAMLDPSSGIERSDLIKGATYRLVGIVGQRASRSGALDGYRVWLRDGEDLVVVAPPASASPTPAASIGPAASPGTGRPVAIASALARGEGSVTIEGIVIAPTRLLDSTGRRVVVEDATAAIEVLLPAAGDPVVGTRLRLTGTLGTAYGAPRLRAASVESLGRASLPTPPALSSPPAERFEWRLMRAVGTLVNVERLGDRWRGELRLGNGAIVPLSGLAGAGIDASGLREGVAATVVGIVRRPYPSASDQRFALVPRSPSDLRLSPAGPAVSAERAGDPSGVGDQASGALAAPADGAPLVDFARLAEHLGRTVRVGGLVVAVEGAVITLDDGTALGRLVLVGTATEAALDLRPGDAIAATGRVEGEPADPEVVVDDAATIVLAGIPVAPGPVGGGSPAPAASPMPTMSVAAAPADGAVPVTIASATALLTVLGVGLAVARRRSAARRRTALIADRLRRVVGPFAGRPDPTVAPARATLAAERGDSA